jgi:DNA polymerase III delta prime subunit
MMKLTDKYAPKTLNEVIFPDQKTRTRIMFHANGQCHGNLLLCGSFGTGKSTIARLLVENIGGNSYVLEDKHFSELLLMKDLDAYIRRCEATAELNNGKYFFIFNEFDVAKGTGLNRLIDGLDSIGSNVMMIITTNHLEKIHGAIKNRCKVISFPPINADAVLSRAQFILKAEGLSLPDHVVLNALKTVEHEGSLRNYMNMLEELLCTFNYLIVPPAPAPAPKITLAQSTDADSTQ